jgi:hypothetical protein
MTPTSKELLDALQAQLDAYRDDEDHGELDDRHLTDVFAAVAKVDPRIWRHLPASCVIHAAAQAVISDESRARGEAMAVLRGDTQLETAIGTLFAASAESQPYQFKSGSTLFEALALCFYFAWGSDEDPVGRFREAAGQCLPLYFQRIEQISDDRVLTAIITWGTREGGRPRKDEQPGEKWEKLAQFARDIGLYGTPGTLKTASRLPWMRSIETTPKWRVSQTQSAPDISPKNKG